VPKVLKVPEVPEVPEVLGNASGAYGSGVDSR
jgi:hypothetical protein